MKISEWTAYNNLPFGMGYSFEYIKFDAEYLGDVTEYEVSRFVEQKFTEDFPDLMDGLQFDNVIDVEYYLYEDYDDEAEYSDFPGYGVCLHFHRDIVGIMVEYVKDKHPDYVLKYLHGNESYDV